MNTKHTPGPWRLEEWHYKGHPRLTIHTNEDAIAQTLDLWRPNCTLEQAEQENLANARLIAEAPAMREFIGAFAETPTETEQPGRWTSDAMDQIIARARAILARIDGEAK